MNFFKKIKDSIYSPEFYSQIAATSVGSALKYFFLLVLILVLIMFGKSAPEFLFGFSSKVKSSVDEVVNMYPQELILTIKSGVVTTNVKEPYFVSDKEGSKFAVIDTKVPYSVEQFNKYSVPVWVTKDTVFYKDDKSEIKSQSLSQVNDATVNKDFVAGLSAKISPWIPYLGPGILLIALVTLYIGYSFKLVYGFILALWIMLLTKIMKKNLDYKSAYKVGIYAMTLPLLIDAIKPYFGWNGFPFMFTLIALVVVGINLNGKK